ncbi:hypothetical protein ACJIZ3_012298 [Penstemon smallii]|uniref:RING-type domain-containing protein n=1 Tax=Penstemon smallii TaxID=265156 RepID=A0ABD3ULK3_9LAMI
MSSQEPLRRSTRARCRNPVLDVDLNVVPPCESRNQEGTSNLNRSLNRQADQEGLATLPAPIDLEAIDDDVIISSPRAFAEAKNNSRRNQGRTVVVDVDTVERPPRNKRRRVPANQTIINSDLFINLDGSSNSVRNSGKSTIVSPSPAPPPKEPTFSCPVCMGPLVEEVSTKCGHIFCKGCIKAAIAAQSKCPTCRRKITMKDVIRIYLPATGSS